MFSLILRLSSNSVSLFQRSTTSGMWFEAALKAVKRVCVLRVNTWNGLQADSSVIEEANMSRAWSDAEV